MYRDMEQWKEIRRRVLVQGVSKRQILRETGMHWTTLEKILAQSEPPGYRQVNNRPKPKIGPWLGRIEGQSGRNLWNARDAGSGQHPRRAQPRRLMDRRLGRALALRRQRLRLRRLHVEQAGRSVARPG